MCSSAQIPSRCVEVRPRVTDLIKRGAGGGRNSERQTQCRRRIHALDNRFNTGAAMGQGMCYGCRLLCSFLIVGGLCPLLRLSAGIVTKTTIFFGSLKGSELAESSYTPIHTHLPTHLLTYTHTHITRAHALARAHTERYTQTHLPTYLPTYLPACLPAYLHTHTHTHTGRERGGRESVQSACPGNAIWQDGSRFT